MLNQSTSGFPAIFKEVPADYKLNMKQTALDTYDIKHLHFHRCIEIGLCVSGSGTCCIDGTEFPYRQGDIQIIFPYMNHLHRSDPPTPAEWCWLYTSYDELFEYIGVSETRGFEHDILTKVATFGTVNAAEYPKTFEALRRMFTEAIAAPDSAYVKQKIALNFYLSFIYLLEESEGKPPVAFPGTTSGIIKLTPALSRIAQCVETGEDVSVFDLAEMCNYSVANFRRIFIRQMQCSPQEYISFCRIRKAKKLLAGTEYSVADIAHATGFINISGFNRAFRNIAGMTPSAYRNQYRVR